MRYVYGIIICEIRILDKFVETKISNGENLVTCADKLKSAVLYHIMPPIVLCISNSNQSQGLPAITKL